jgi:hypothetical protein
MVSWKEAAILGIIFGIVAAMDPRRRWFTISLIAFCVLYVWRRCDLLTACEAFLLRCAAP